MSAVRVSRLVALLTLAVMTGVTGCSFQGVNSLALPGTVGSGPGAVTYHLEIANVGTLESNSPVMIDDVTVGVVRSMSVRDWHANVVVSVRPDVVVPANAMAMVGQTSLLGSMHIALDPPVGQAPTGRLAPGATLPLTSTRAYPSTEQTLSTVSTVVNGGGLGQIGDIIHNFNVAFAGSETQTRDLLGRLDRFVGVLDDQRNSLIDSIAAMDRLAGSLNQQSQVIATALDKLPPALQVLLRQRPQITTALDRLRVFSDTARRLVDDSQADLVTNLQNLAPTIQALADVGPDIDEALALVPTFPLSQNILDRAVRGDYLNLYATIDLTKNRLKRGLGAGTRFDGHDLPLVPAPGDPGYDAFYSDDPLHAPIVPTQQGPREPVPVGPGGALPPGFPPISGGTPGGPN